MAGSWDVRITETLTKDVRVEASSWSEAVAEVRRQYADEVVVLDSGDFALVHFDSFNATEGEGNG